VVVEVIEAAEVLDAREITRYAINMHFFLFFEALRPVMLCL
jgi:hypothetical protein